MGCSAKAAEPLQRSPRSLPNSRRRHFGTVKIGSASQTWRPPPACCHTALRNFFFARRTRQTVTKGLPSDRRRADADEGSTFPECKSSNPATALSGIRFVRVLMLEKLFGGVIPQLCLTVSIHRSLLAKLGQVLLQASPEGARDFSLKSLDDVAKPTAGLHDLDGGVGHLAARKVDLQPNLSGR